MIEQAFSSPASAGSLPTLASEAQPAMPHYVVFKLDDDHYALPLTQVARAVRMVAVTPAPDLPPWILSVINMAGQVLPVIDLRQRFAHPPRPPALTDRLLITRTVSQSLALMVDEVLKVLEPTPAQLEAVSPALAQSQPLRATIREDERLILVLDAERLAQPS
jgi:purine-binding chemotaxis protein CheW